MIDRDDVFTCRNFRLGSCPRSDAIVLEERADSVQLGCKTCRCGWVVTLPEGKAKARYENRLDEIKRRQQEQRERERKPIIFA